MEAIPVESHGHEDVGATVVPIFKPFSNRKESKIPCSTFVRLLNRAIHFLGITEKALALGVIADFTGLSPRTITRYATGEFRRVPQSVLDAALCLVRMAKEKDLIVFHRGKDGHAVVQRCHLVEIADYAIAEGFYPSRHSLFRKAEARLGLPADRIARLYRCNDIQLIDKEIYDTLRELTRCREYDPSSSYQVGERIRHPSLGVGVVREKLALDKVCVFFFQIGRRILRENLFEAPIGARYASSLANY